MVCAKYARPTSLRKQHKTRINNNSTVETYRISNRGISKFGQLSHQHTTTLILFRSTTRKQPADSPTTAKTGFLQGRKHVPGQNGEGYQGVWVWHGLLYPALLRSYIVQESKLQQKTDQKRQESKQNGIAA